MPIGNPISDLATQQSERLIFFTLAQLCIIILVARLAGNFAAKIAQAAVVGEIIAGILLGPSLFVWIMPVPYSLGLPFYSVRVVRCPFTVGPHLTDV